MSRVNPTDFANFLMGGLRTGINLGESANQQAFQQQQFNANEQQRGFANSLALQDQSMQAQALDMQVQDRLRRWQEEDDQRTANDVLLKSMMADDATFEAGVQSLLPHIGKASPDVQRGLLNRKQYLDEYKRDAAKLDSFRNSGGKLSEEEASYYRKKGHLVPREMLSKTAREMDDQKEQQDKEAMVVSALQSGLVGQNEVPTLMKYASTKALSWDLGARRAIQQQQQKMAAEQQKQQLEQQSMQAATPALGRYRNGTATDADLIQLKNANLITASGIEPNKPMEDKSVFARKQIEDIDKELQFVDQQLMEMGVASRARVSDPVTINQDKAKKGAPNPNPWFGSPEPATPEYTKTQQLLSRRDQLLQARQQVGTQLVGGQQPAAQVDGRAIIQQFTAQNGRKPTTQELADLLRRASQGTPQQPVLQR